MCFHKNKMNSCTYHGAWCISHGATASLPKMRQVANKLPTTEDIRKTALEQSAADKRESLQFCKHTQKLRSGNKIAHTVSFLNFEVSKR